MSDNRINSKALYNFVIFIIPNPNLRHDHGRERGWRDGPYSHNSHVLARDNTFVPWVSALICSKGVSEEQQKKV